MEIKLCKCGCGNLVKKTYIRGHYMKGRKLSIEQKLKISHNHHNVSGKHNPMYGKKHLDSTKTKMSEKAKLRVGNKNPFYNKKHSAESKSRIGLKMSVINKGRVYSKSRNDKIGVASKDRWKNNEFKNRMIKIMTGRKLSEETKLKIKNSNIRNGNYKNLSKRMKSELNPNYKGKLWNSKNKEQKEKWLKNILKGLMKRPTSLEKQMIQIIQKNNLPYKYVGDGSFLIGYKNPDFININGKKICVEVANTFHHDEDYEEKRKKHFRKYGWDCIVFRINKLEEKVITEKLKQPINDEVFAEEFIIK